MKHLSADIVVLSAGTAGLAAAATAAEGDASVIAFEKTAHTGGTTGSGIFAIESRLQKARQYQLTREEAFKMYMDFTHWRVNARLVKTLMDESADTIDWLEGLGVEFKELYSHGVGNAYTQHTVKSDTPPGKGAPAAVMMKILMERAKAKGADIFLKTPVIQLLKKDNRITGVIAQDASGEKIRAKSKAVIVATGGYSIGTMPGMPGGIGDGIRLAKEAGASVKESNNKLSTDKAAPRMRMGFPNQPVLDNAFQQPGLWINSLGERFMNEEILLGMAFATNAISRQPGQQAFSIFDETTLEYYAHYGFDYLPFGDTVSRQQLADYKTEVNQLRATGSDSIFTANSLEEISTRTGIELTSLQQTVSEYNKAAETGRDNAFGKAARYLRPVTRPPFFVSLRRGNAITSWNGIKVNHKTEVLTPDYNVITGLYAAGMDIGCEIYYDTYPFILPATAMGFAINSGRIAAMNALEYIKSENKN